MAPNLLQWIARHIPKSERWGIFQVVEHKYDNFRIKKRHSSLECLRGFKLSIGDRILLRKTFFHPQAISTKRLGTTITLRICLPSR